jgi:hypothetical protein
MTTRAAEIRFLLCLIGLFAGARPQTLSAEVITAAEAKDHIGEKATVCGKVVSTHYAADIRGKPTFLDLDSPYPDQTFTIVIRGSDRAKFGEPEVTYRQKSVCVTGKIKELLGVPGIVASDPAQIKIQQNGER